jgi:hypothetical protein
MHLISIFFLVGTVFGLGEADYPLNIVTEYNAGLNGTQAFGWSLSGSVVYEQAWPGAE